MGYTHYFRRIPGYDRAAYAALCADVSAIVGSLRDAGSPLAGPLGEGLPEITAERVAFNGAAPDDYETFSWEANCCHWDPYAKPGARVFCFCKTAQRPYDVAVVAVLLCAHYHYGDAVTLGSDGDASELGPGLALARSIFPSRGLTLAPFGVTEGASCQGDA